jgi:hypothetical protein
VRVRTLIVDDNPTFIESVSSFLARRPTIELLGCAHSGSEALERARRETPDLVLVDLVMPSMNGLDSPKRCVHCHSRRASSCSRSPRSRLPPTRALLPRPAQQYEITSRLMPLIAQPSAKRAGRRTDQLSRPQGGWRSPRSDRRPSTLRVTTCDRLAGHHPRAREP